MGNLKDISILYIDDEDNIRNGAVEYLSYYCSQVYEAKNGLEGYEVYKAKRPNIIITDINMPKMNGLEMIQKIREEDEETKIIVATAYLEPEYLLLAVELGLIKYLVKPITEDKLMPVLKKCSSSSEKVSSVFKIDKTHSFDMLNQTLFYDKKLIDLTKKELDFLTLLIENFERAVKYDEFNQRIWEGMMSEDAMRSVVRELRAKISKHSVKNISKIGYQIQGAYL